MEAWRREAGSFLGTGARTIVSTDGSGSISRRHGSTDVQALTLLQDYPEGGLRAPDVELFAKALQVRKIRRLVEPHGGPHTNFALYWVHQWYGYLRQGARILTSTCDFVHFDRRSDRHNTQHQAPRHWRYILKSYGAMRGLHVRQPTERSATTDMRDPTMQDHRVWSLGEVLMEPLFYNPWLSGRWGRGPFPGLGRRAGSVPGRVPRARGAVMPDEPHHHHAPDRRATRCDTVRPPSDR